MKKADMKRALAWLEKVYREAEDLADSLDPKRKRAHEIVKIIDRMGSVAGRGAATVAVYCSDAK